MSERLKESLRGYGFIAPFLGVFALFIGWPVIYSFWLSLHDTSLYTNWYDRFGDMSYVGFAHYARILSFDDTIFWYSLLLTGIYAAITIPGTVVVSLALALLLSRKLRGAGFFRAGFFLPNIFDMFVVGTIWFFLLNPADGLTKKMVDLIGGAFGLIGLGFEYPRSGPLGSPWLCLPTIAFVMILKSCGFGMILFLTAIANLNQSVLEAAEVDGCGPWRKLVHIILPQVKPTILFLVTTGLIASLNAFTEIFALAEDGGPAIELPGGGTMGSARVAGFHIFRTFDDSFYGQAAAISFCLLVVALVVSAVNFYFLTPRD